MTGISPPTKNVASFPGVVTKFGDESTCACPEVINKLSVGASVTVRKNALEIVKPLAGCRFAGFSTIGKLGCPIV